MIVILTRRGDPAGPALATLWHPYPVAILTARDLSNPASEHGWRQRLPQASSDTVVADGQRILQRDITAILTLTSAVLPQELPHILEQDRSYVAAEMTAFLLFWLSSLSCPVLNRPAPPCLAGPNWLRDQWVHAAAQAGIPVQPFRRTATLNPPPEEPAPQPQTTLTVIGEQVLGDAHPALHRHSLTLARRARVDLLAVHFTNAESDALFLGANSFPGLTPAAEAAALLTHLQAARS